MQSAKVLIRRFNPLFLAFHTTTSVRDKARENSDNYTVVIYLNKYCLKQDISTHDYDKNPKNNRKHAKSKVTTH